MKVQEGKVIRGVIIRLGPKAGRLTGRVVDARTGNPIQWGGVTFYEANSPQEYMGASLLRGSVINVSVPSTKPFRMSVWGHGYVTWYYGKDGTKSDAEPLRFSPGETRNMVVRLQPIRDHPTQ